MELSKIVESIKCSMLYKSQKFEEVDISGVVVTNMMSSVLAADHDDFLLVTELTSAQVLRTADIVSASAVLIAANQDGITPSIVALAKEFDITLLSTILSATESRHIIDKLV